ncbi:hypothetical protein E0L93_13610 [Rubrobacter taiwanensis]|uniref:Uncharacterized protein n=1 Tax=Rubrobacter taiwanensis TaxID=185139 RepID=A0A4R1BDM2_9ACTN|nr:hypothetical protein [Rubrobacter taiwanensis]TCJ15088.1 hypothetical protein E0L93_13610 [Rubrobacter taiwanensis]
MNVDVLFLFFSAVLTTAISVVIVIAILRTQYLPVIRRLENELAEDRSAGESGRTGGSGPGRE